MKILKALSGLSLLVFSLLSVVAQADTVVSCAWSQTGYTYVGATPVQVFTCMDGTAAAAVQRKAANGSSYCDINAASGYYTSGACLSPTVYKVVATNVTSSSLTSSSVAACPKAGQTITVPQGRYDLIAAFCGSSCSFGLSGSTNGSTLTGYCR